jgi:hypothetical protein
MRVRLASALVFVAACTNDPVPTGDPPPTPGPPDIPDIGFHLPMQSLDGFTYTVQIEAGFDYFAEIVDTGSSTTAIASNKCQSCKFTPLYGPGATAMDKGTKASTQYADGSGWDGEVYHDQSWLRGPFVGLDLVAITTQSQFFDPDSSYQGILGLGPKQLLETGTSSYMDGLAAQYDNTEVMAFRLCPFTGDMWLQGYDPEAASADVQYTPMLPIDDSFNPFYSINVSDFAFGGTSMGFNNDTFGYTLLDTGTSISYIPDPALNAVITKINNDTTFKALFPGQHLADTFGGDCVQTAGVTSGMVDEMLPPFTVSFPAMGGGTFSVDIPASSSYLYPAGDGTFCLAFSSSGPDAATYGSLFGDTLLTGMLTVFDVQNLQIGMAPAAGCDPFDPLPASPRRAKQSPFFRPPPTRRPTSAH